MLYQNGDYAREGKDKIMKYIEKKGMNLSKIGLGTGRFGTRIQSQQAYEMLDLFVENGGNVIDTARNYYEWVEKGRGKSEETIGLWMDKQKNRNNVYISTKGGVYNQGRKFFVNLSRENLLEECKESLNALRTDYIDIYLLHRDEPDRPVEEIMESLQVVKENAQIRMLGVCNWSVERVKRANNYAETHGLKKLDVVQTWWSIAEYTPNMWNDPTTTWMDKEMYDYLIDNHLLGMAYTSQAKGFFQKAINEGYENISDFLKQRIVTQENMKRLQEIKKYCMDRKVSPTAVVNGYITQNDLDGVALVSCSDLHQLGDILNNCNVEIDKEWLKQFEIK